MKLLSNLYKNIAKNLLSKISILNKRNKDEMFGLVSHVAIIMDGNARWANLRSLPVGFGHKIGAENIENTIDSAIYLGIKFITFYAFSMENWMRPKQEVDYLIEILDHYLDSKTQYLKNKKVKILVSGNFDLLSEEMVNKINNAISQTEDESLITVNIAFSYSGRQEIIDAFNKILAKSDGCQKITQDEMEPKPQLLEGTQEA